MSLTDSILSDPTVVSLLAATLLALVWYVRGIGPRQAVALDRLRRPLWRVLDPLARRVGRPLLIDKTDRDDEDICHVAADRRALLAALWEHGFAWNPLSMVKYRDVDGRRQYALSVVHRESPSSPSQQDVHIFPGPRGGWDVYGHSEPSVTDPADHVAGGQQVSGDPEGVVRAALETAGIDCE